jgi:hypothetical protein
MHLPPGARGDVKIYTPTTYGVAGAAPSFQSYTAWHKPRGVTMVSMTCVAAGGGGGGGFSRATNNPGGGGAGGACSGIARFICPAMFLPDVMYVIVPSGGCGGAASANGSPGGNSFITMGRPVTTGSHTIPVLPNIVLASGVNVPGGGGAGAAGAGGTGGTVPTVAVTQPIHTFGQWFAITGIVGGAGGAHTGAIGTNITLGASISMSPGSGGGGSTSVATNSAGGDQRMNNDLNIGNQGNYRQGTDGIVAGGSGTSSARDGNAGIRRITPFFNSGGSGGSTNDLGQAGMGGKGGYGCGGGGGGAGTTGGQGGDGGDGLVVILSW